MLLTDDTPTPRVFLTVLFQLVLQLSIDGHSGCCKVSSEHNFCNQQFLSVLQWKWSVDNRWHAINVYAIPLFILSAVRLFKWCLCKYFIESFLFVLNDFWPAHLVAEHNNFKTHKNTPQKWNFVFSHVEKSSRQNHCPTNWSTNVCCKRQLSLTDLEVINTLFLLGWLSYFGSASKHSVLTH